MIQAERVRSGLMIGRVVSCTVNQFAWSHLFHNYVLIIIRRESVGESARQYMLLLLEMVVLKGDDGMNGCTSEYRCHIYRDICLYIIDVVTV